MANSIFIRATPALKSYELFIGLRYTRARQRTRFISFISVISVVGMALGIIQTNMTLRVIRDRACCPPQRRGNVWDR